MSCGWSFFAFLFFSPKLKLWYSFPCLLPSLDCGCTIRPNYPSSLNKRYYRFGLNLQLNRRMPSEGDNCSRFGEANIDCGGEMTPSGGRTFYCTRIRGVKEVNNQYWFGCQKSKSETSWIFIFLLLKLPSGTIYTKRINIFAHKRG